MNRGHALCGMIAAGLMAGQAWGQPPPQERPAYGAPLTLEDAQILAAAAEATAKRMGLAVAVAIVEPTGDMVLLHKMSGAQYSAPDLALDKARASARFRRPTKEFEDGLAGGRQAVLGIPEAIPVAGGVMVIRQGRLIGAVGVSGGVAAQDNQVAEAAASALH